MRITPRATIISKHVSHSSATLSDYKPNSSFSKINHYQEYGSYNVRCPKCGEAVVQISYHREDNVETYNEKFCPFCGTQIVFDDNEEDNINIE